MDSESTGKKEPGIEASGDQSTEPQTQKKKMLPFDLEVITTPLNQRTSTYPPQIRRKEPKWLSQISLDSSLPISTNLESPPTSNLHPLWEQWLKSPQPQLSRAPSLEPLDLQYPPEQAPWREESRKALKSIFKAIQRAKEKIQAHQEEATRQEDQEVEAILMLEEETTLLEEGEIPETPEEGEIWEETL